jgi:hypothetical protein
MVRRVIAGILGYVAGALPLVLVNVLVNSSAFGDNGTTAAQNTVLFGAVGLLGGTLLGGTIAGWIAGRRGGAAGGGGAGAIAGVLYAITMIAVIRVGAQERWNSALGALDPIRTSAALILVATLLTMVALAVGALAGPGRGQSERWAPAAPRGTAASGPGGSSGARAVRHSPERVGRPSEWERPQSPSRPPTGVSPRSAPRRSAPRDRW